MGCERAGFWTPWGEGSLSAVDGVLVEVTLPPLPAGDPRLLELPAARRRREPPVHPEASSAERWAAQLDDYFAGDRITWTPDEVDVAALGLTPFREAVYRAILAVPPGATVTYSELAVLAGRPGAARAVGTAMAENPVPVVIPCHRCVRADGSLGRYGDDDRWKPLLLRFEGWR